MLYFNNSSLNDLFDELIESAENGFRKGMLDTDIVENDNAFLVTMDLPQVKKENISIDTNKGYLTVTVKKDDSKEDTKGLKYISRERKESFGERSFYLGEIEADGIKAKLENGVLNIIVPKVKAKEENKKVISIE